MTTLMNNEAFRDSFARLGDVTLDPARHSAANAMEHSHAVATRARDLALLNGFSEVEATLLYDLGLVHDIGKVSGSTHPAKSVEMLPAFGLTDPAFVALVKSHDLNLPWFISHEKGQTPTDKAWRRLAAGTDMRLLCVFMVADRVDCPGGWRANRALVWFLEEANRRGLIVLAHLTFDVVPAGDDVELCAGALVVRGTSTGPELLAIRVRSAGYELPKGHVEAREGLREAAGRELREETGLAGEANPGEHLATVVYPLRSGATKCVHYFRFIADSDVQVDPRPSGVREIRWVDRQLAAGLEWVSTDLATIVHKAFVRGQ